MFKVGDIVEHVVDCYGECIYQYREVKSVAGEYIGIQCIPPSSYSEDISSGERPNWGFRLFKKVEHPEKLPCYKYILLHGHSPEHKK